MARMVAFLVPDDLAHGLNRLAVEMRAQHGLDHGVTAAFALQAGMASMRRSGLASVVSAGGPARLRAQIMGEDGGATGRLAMRGV